MRHFSWPRHQTLAPTVAVALVGTSYAPWALALSGLLVLACVALLAALPAAVCRRLVRWRWVRPGIRLRLQLGLTSLSLLVEDVTLHDDIVPWVNSYALGYLLPATLHGLRCRTIRITIIGPLAARLLLGALATWARRRLGLRSLSREEEGGLGGTRGFTGAGDTFGCARSATVGQLSSSDPYAGAAVRCLLVGLHVPHALQPPAEWGGSSSQHKLLSPPAQAVADTLASLYAAAAAATASGADSPFGSAPEAAAAAGSAVCDAACAAAAAALAAGLGWPYLDPILAPPIRTEWGLLRVLNGVAFELREATVSLDVPGAPESGSAEGGSAQGEGAAASSAGVGAPPVPPPLPSSCFGSAVPGATFATATAAARAAAASSMCGAEIGWVQLKLEVSLLVVRTGLGWETVRGGSLGRGVGVFLEDASLLIAPFGQVAHEGGGGIDVTGGSSSRTSSGGAGGDDWVSSSRGAGSGGGDGGGLEGGVRSRSLWGVHTGGAPLSQGPAAAGLQSPPPPPNATASRPSHGAFTTTTPVQTRLPPSLDSNPPTTSSPLPPPLSTAASSRANPLSLLCSSLALAFSGGSGVKSQRARREQSRRATYAEPLRLRSRFSLFSRRSGGLRAPLSSPVLPSPPPPSPALLSLERERENTPRPMLLPAHTPTADAQPPLPVLRLRPASDYTPDHTGARGADPARHSHSRRIFLFGGGWRTFVFGEGRRGCALGGEGARTGASSWGAQLLLARQPAFSGTRARRSVALALGKVEVRGLA